MNNYEISASEASVTGPYDLLWPLPAFAGTSPSTTVSLRSGPAGFTVLFAAALAGSPFYKPRPSKGRVFEDDCLEIFIRPQLSFESFFPAPFYYGWEINAGGSMLDYRAGVGDEGRRIIGSGTGASVIDGSGARPGIEPVHGILHEDILGTLISFDYDWKSKAVFSSKIDISAGLWTLDLSIPWSDFGLEDAPHGETWYFTVNRIEASAAERGGEMAVGSAGAFGGNPGLACLHEGITEPRFHQPALFPALHIN